MIWIAIIIEAVQADMVDFAVLLGLQVQYQIELLPVAR